MNCKVAVLNVKATHPDFKKAKVVELAVSIFDQGQLINQFSQLVNPRTKIHPSAIEEHGITPAMVHGQPTILQVLPTMKKMLSSVRHIITFSWDDPSILERQLGRGATAKLLWDFCDNWWTLYCGTNCLEMLDALCRDYSVARPEQNRALSDTVAIYKCFRKLVFSKKWRLPEDFCLELETELSYEDELPEPNIPRLKAETDKLIRYSKSEYKKDPNQEVNFGCIDRSILPYIELINENPLLTTTYSTSDQGAAVAVVFRDQCTRDAYLTRIKEKVSSVKIWQYPVRGAKWRGPEDWILTTPNTSKKAVAERFWKEILPILRRELS